MIMVIAFAILFSGIFGMITIDVIERRKNNIFSACILTAMEKAGLIL